MVYIVKEDVKKVQIVKEDLKKGVNCQGGCEEMCNLSGRI